MDELWHRFCFVLTCNLLQQLLVDKIIVAVADQYNSTYFPWQPLLISLMTHFGLTCDYEVKICEIKIPVTPYLLFS